MATLLCALPPLRPSACLLPQQKSLIPRRRIQQSAHQPRQQAQGPGNPHRNFYKSFGRPIAKVFLGALFTYQVLYWGWMKLESIEKQEEKEGTVRYLESRLKEAMLAKGKKS